MFSIVVAVNAKYKKALRTILQVLLPLNIIILILKKGERAFFIIYVFTELLVIIESLIHLNFRI